MRSEQAKALQARVSELAVLDDSKPLECISTADLDAIRRKVRAPRDNGEPMRVKAILQELTEEVRIDARDAVKPGLPNTGGSTTVRVDGRNLAVRKP